MNEIEEIQNWYHSQCNEDWEHLSGVSIGTLDNPGWFVKIDIENTSLENAVYEEFSYGVGDKTDTSGVDWLVTKLEDNQFVGYGGPYKLKEILNIFIQWSKSNT